MSVTTVRASSWGSLFDCAYKWEGVHLLGIKSPSSPRAHLGTSIHASTAAFDVSRMNGSNLTAYDTAELLIHTLRNPDREVDWKADKLTVQEAERIALPLHTKYCNEVSPRYEYLAVERTATPLEIDCGGGVIIRLTGQLDRARICKTGDGKGIADVKTGGAAVSEGVAKTKGHAAQIGTYEILEEHTTGEPCTAPAHIIGLKTKGKPEVGIGEIRSAKQMMVGTEDFPGLIQIGAEMFRTGLFPPNPQSFLCSAKYCPRWSTCPYHE
ncbi:PD-(D/E)XK nuclease family protein [Pseudomonas alliivorans]|nr:PD-(D/E)XK nuclease family protein [Pseudomonas alliivorans]MEE4688798.1 PD-(D/E)XK nuclease family protein [Pseudomonas alliivorans]MEE4710208.1 PD-(D/E)XK nuclease family protein [Pseudomonas alliivorans]MEE4725185.1 PD-(D/E)XK nuclease family protein [Pseudomonas alliivorans]MEE4765954.1 PD-(D/E)XK nuclease family protein [Pseudomonas alliivorans]